jgi:hypothetical protein
MYHRERYFFICGCKQIVMKGGATSRRRSLREENSQQFHIPVSGSLSEIYIAPFQAELRRLCQGIHRFLPIKEIS